MKKYEIMYILRPEIEEEARKNLISNINNLLTKNGAKVEDVNEWGMRELAYEIQKVKKGYYVVVKLSSNDSKAVAEFNRVTKLDSQVLRSLVTNIG
ncbi:MAG TPA: 30S ribosomal protein S6 [Firmicutes bacterium]|nr:30S ribosomal protein S6 [Bacillota bacterium]